MLRRSADGGRTWSPQRIIASVPGPHRKNPVALAQKLAEPDAIAYNNPVAIADLKTGAVHLVFCLEYMRAFSMRSDDDGRTFSAPVEITPAFEKFRPEYEWKVLATGPGHGIQLANGRLLIPVWLSTGTGGHAHRPSVVSVIFSDDGGRAWQRGEIAVPNTSEFVYPSESAAVELAGGKVMLNTRSESKANRRLVTFSRDGATGWTTPEFHPQLVEPICMAGMVRLSTEKAGGGNRILFVNPDNLERADGKSTPGLSRDRKNVTVRLSYDEGRTWPVSRPLEPGYSGYSDIAAARDGAIYCLYERAAANANAFEPAALTLARFNLEWLTGGEDSWGRRNR
jgi:sialidase-1